MNETDAIDALRRLQLSKYEAEVFIALQKLAVGTARDVARITDVPRSQVYGAAESLEERGLIEVQQSNPMQYRALDLDEAKARLRREFERERNQAFDFLETVQGAYSESDEQQEAIWTLHSRETITNRVRQLVREAEEYVVYGSRAEFLDQLLVDMLVEQAARDIDVTVVSADHAVVDEFGDAAVQTVHMPAERMREDWIGGRIVVVDGDTILLSVLGGEKLPRFREETAFWSSKTRFAAVLVQLIDNWFGPLLEL